MEEKNESANFAVSSGNCNALYSRIAEEGIVVGLRRYRLLGILLWRYVYSLESVFLFYLFFLVSIIIFF